MSLRPRAAVQGLSRAVHGGINYAELRELGIAPQEVTDFSANLNPFGLPPGIKESLARVDITQYPDSESLALRKALSARLGVPVESILVANGSTELIYLAALAYFEPGDRVLLIRPSFGEYAVASTIAGAVIIEQDILAGKDFSISVDETIRLVQQHNPRGIFLTNPNNPTGQYLGRTEVEKVVQSAPHTLVVLDEAYVSAVDSPWSSLGMIGGGNLLVLRSMTKDFSLAGIRLGYGIARDDVIDVLRRVQPPWSVNSLAQQAGVFALREDEYVRRCHARIREAKDYLVAGLSRLGFTVVPSETSFFLVKVGNARELRRNLLKHRILVRDCASFGLPDYIRVATRAMPECQRLIGALAQVTGQRA